MVNEGSPGFGRVADCRVLTAVLVERGDGRTLGFEFLELIFEGIDCAEVVLGVGFEPCMVSLEGVRVDVCLGCRVDEGVDLVHHCLACGNRLRELGLECVKVAELIESSFEYLGAGWWCELAGGLLERGDQLVFGYVLGCAWLVAGGIVFAVAPPDASLVAAARREAP